MYNPFGLLFDTLRFAPHRFETGVPRFYQTDRGGVQQGQPQYSGN